MNESVAAAPLCKGWAANCSRVGTRNSRGLCLGEQDARFPGGYCLIRLLLMLTLCYFLCSISFPSLLFPTLV